MKELVSILIPLYNAEKYIKLTIESCLSQSWPEIEIIVVDDGSTDNSLSIVQNFNSEKVIVLTQKNSGASSARNKAFSISKGKFIQYLDADDLLDTYKIEKQLNILINESSNTMIASGLFYELLNDGTNTNLIFNNGNKSFQKPIDWLYLANYNKAMFPPMVWLTPRDLIIKAGPWNENITYNDDTEFFTRVLLSAEGIEYCPDAISYYRRSVKNSLGSRKDYTSLKSRFNVIKITSKQLTEKENSKRIKEAIAYQYSSFIYSVYPRYHDLIKEASQLKNSLGIKVNFKFGSGITSQISNIIGWKAAKIIKYFYSMIFGA